MSRYHLGLSQYSLLYHMISPEIGPIQPAYYWWYSTGAILSVAMDLSRVGSNVYIESFLESIVISRLVMVGRKNIEHV